MKKDLTELVFILDKSGSMSGLESDTIGVFNAMLKKQKEVAGECIITTVLFDHEYELLHDRLDIRAVNPMTEDDYEVRGTTALLDAIGMTIEKIAKVQRSTAEDYRAEKVLFVIITDGAENASREYTADKVKAKIEAQKKEHGWEFVFLGANIDAVETAEKFGMDPELAADYVPDGAGTELNFRVMSETVTAYRTCGSTPKESLDAIRKDMKKRGKRKC